ncbi:MAG: MerR family transcriptional regulator [Chitinophagales bacterium]|nr:MerR family transcriptional regulator [Chitinophagales bacterium]MDW8428157.1 MerR family transcriptional regulator [Chitinophagales bacterium]
MKSGADLLSSKYYYSITEVAEILGVSASTLRFWEKSIGIIHTRKNSRGDRRYTKKDIERLQTIKHLLQEEGYTLAGVRKRLRSKRNPELALQVLDTLREVKSLLEEIMTFLSQVPESPAASNNTAQNHHTSES